MGERGIMAVGAGTAKAPSNASSPLQKAIGELAPQNYSESDIDQLVQVITDQIMASA